MVQEPQRPAADEAWTPIAVLEHEVEAALLGELLEAQGIPHVMETFGDTVFSGVFQLQRGWGRVLAPERCRAPILDALQRLRAETAGGDPPSDAAPAAPDDVPIA